MIKVTRELITNMFRKIRTALNEKADKSALSKKANTEDVVLIENIGEANMVAPLDNYSKVPRENLYLPNIGILEVKKFVSGITEEPSSTSVWDYVIFNTSTNRFCAYNNGKYYGNWLNSEDYRNSVSDNRKDRIFVVNSENKFYRWNGSTMVEIGFPMGNTAGTVFSGADGAALKTTVSNYENYILAAALADKIVFTNTISAKRYSCQYDILYDSSSNQYSYYNQGTLQPITIAALSATLGLLQMPIQITKDMLAYTPFKDVEGNINYVIKGKKIGEFRQWFLVMTPDSEDQTYIAGTSSNSNYYNQSYTCYYNKYNRPWELWLPVGTARQSVYIDW